METDEDRLMNFGPYRMNTYGEALRANPKYVKYLIKVNKRDNQKARFAHWMMAFIVETFFAEDKEQEEEGVVGDQKMPEGRAVSDLGGRQVQRELEQKRKAVIQIPIVEEFQ